MKINRRFLSCFVASFLSTLAVVSAYGNNTLTDSIAPAVVDSSLLVVSPVFSDSSIVVPAVPVKLENESVPAVKTTENKTIENESSDQNAQKIKEEELRIHAEEIEIAKKKSEKEELALKNELMKREKELDKIEKRKAKEEAKAKKLIEKREKDLENRKKKIEKEKEKVKKAKEKRVKELLKSEKKLNSMQKNYLKLDSRIQKDKLRLDHKIQLGSLSPIEELEAKEKIGQKELKAEKLRLEMNAVKAKISSLSRN